MEFTQDDLKRKEFDVEENTFKVKEEPKENYEYQVDLDYVNDIRNKLTELEHRSRRDKMRIDGIAEEPGT